MLVLNFVLALVWMALQRSFTLVDFLVGFLLGFGIIVLTQRALRESDGTPQAAPEINNVADYPRQSLLWIAFIAFAVWSIIKANIDVARIVVRPKLNIKPGIIAIPLDVKSEAGITLLANLITLTPGTVTLDVSSDRRTIYVHCIDIQDEDAIRDDIKDNFERRVLKLFP